MHRMNLRGVDLNLLVVLKALLEERNTTKAAERLAMSQPAVSRALARLRLLYDDPLLIRTPWEWSLPQGHRHSCCHCGKYCTT